MKSKFLSSLNNLKEKAIWEFRDAREIKDNLKKLNHKNFSQKDYDELLYKFIVINEGKKTKAYLDTASNVTVGIGFNMGPNVKNDPKKRTKAAKEEWHNTFANKNDEIINQFDEVKNKKVSMNEKQIRQLYDYCIEKRIKEMKNMHLEEFLPNERACIEDGYFNAPDVVKSGTKFFTHMRKYVDSNRSEKKYLCKAIFQILIKSNSTRNLGLANRRYKQALMLCDDIDETITCLLTESNNDNEEANKHEILKKICGEE